MEKNEDKIRYFFDDLHKKGYISDIIPIKKNFEIIAYKLIRSHELLPNNISQIYNYWIPVWHGTKFKFLESIIRNGLKMPKLPSQCSIPKYLFVSPSIFFSSEILYSDRIISNSKKWAVLVEARLKPNSYIKREAVLVKRKINGEPKELEYLVESENDVIVTSILFILEEFLNEANEFSEGKIINLTI